ncbi:hypothetical protein Tco_1327806, partial [Tanacetum coccineum]
KNRLHDLKFISFAATGDYLITVKVLEDHGFFGSRLAVEQKKVEPVIINPNAAVVIRPDGLQEGVGLAGMRVLFASILKHPMTTSDLFE